MRPAVLLKWLQVGAIAVSSAFLLAAMVFLIIEPSWVHTHTRTDEEAFLSGPTGTDMMPLVVMQVLPDMFPENFQPGGSAAGNWVRQFGFIAGKPDVNYGLPVGFVISNYRPKSGGPSPVPFVGFSCAMCHTNLIRPVDGRQAIFVKGMGTTSLDFIAYFEVLRSSFLDEQRFTVRNIDTAYYRKFGRHLTLTEKLTIAAWIPGTRNFFKTNLPKYDDPFTGMDLRDSRYMPNGPSRTQPFRNLVRLIIDRPATTGDSAYCKIPSLYEQRNRHWGQYDGSVANRLSRSVLAAIATGATVDNLVLPDITSSVTGAVNYTVDLKGPRYADVFPAENSRLDPDQIKRGHALYIQSCAPCHGSRDERTGDWQPGARTGEVIPAEIIGTDAERVNFRHYDTITDALFNFFPADNPLRPKREDLRPGPLGDTHGYINAPIEAVFARTPYLHNGSVLTLAELINLKPRRAVFYRGANLYDPNDVGLVSPDSPTPAEYFRFDTSERGNSNKGHDYPWAYHGNGWDRDRLLALLDYLKTL
jgi:mono/diheme cytochrome c family protein